MKSGIHDLSTGIVLIGFSIAGILIANNFGESQTETLYGPDFFPKLVLMVLILCSLFLTIKGFLTIMSKSNKQNGRIDRNNMIRIPLYIILLIVYINLFFIIGFVYSTIIFLVIGQYLFGMKKWIKLIIISIVVPFILYYLFTVLFNIPLP